MGAEVPADLVDRLRGIILHGAPLGGPLTMNDLVIEALEAHAATLEAELNAGKPFPPVPAGRIRTGRPPTR